MTRTRIVALSFILAACQRRTARQEDAPHEDQKPETQSTLEARANTSTITRDTTDRMRLDLGYGIAVNKGSKMQREWITVRDSVLPADFTGRVGIGTVYESTGQYSSGYRYAAKYDLRARDSITAFEMRCSIFDIWGDPVRTLSHTEVEDIPAGVTRSYTPKWELYSENEASEHYASICFMARVRTASGRVVAANMTPIITEAVRFSKRFAASDLEPKAPTKTP